MTEIVAFIHGGKLKTLPYSRVQAFKAIAPRGIKPGEEFLRFQC